MATDPLLQEAPGWYGKLASLGDFAERRLTAGFVQRADAWLSEAMSAGRAQFGAAWLDLYLTAPLLRFAWAPGVVDAAWWFGVLMPSCDNVGRYFPLLIGQRREQPPRDRFALDHLEAWLEHLETAATSTLGDGASVEAFEKALGEAPCWPAACLPASSGSRVAAGAEGDRPFGPASSLRQWLHGIAVDSLQNRFAGCSIWWQGENCGQSANANVVLGLPEPAAFARMLSTA